MFFLKKVNKLYIIIGLISFIVVFVAIYLYTYINNLDILSHNLFNVNSYYSNYEITVISNKNKNIYTMEEWYKKSEFDEKFKFRYDDFLGNKVNMVILNDKIEIVNENEINKLIFEGMNMRKTNLFSIATYINIINNTENRDLFDISDKINEDGSITYTILFKGDNEYSFFSEGLDINKVEFNISENIPKFIYIYDSEGIKIYIEYIEFKNEYFEDDMFV